MPDEPTRLAPLGSDPGTRIEGGSEHTVAAPPFRAPAGRAGDDSARHLLGLPNPGQRLHDFELLKILGTGAFARVFLAHQVSLDRHVALKVSYNRGQEARTLASLEHDHIVQ